MSSVHKIIESIDLYPQLFGVDARDRNTQARGVLNATHFVFDFLPPEELMEFGIDTFNASLLRLPFRTVYYEFQPYSESPEIRFGTLVVDELDSRDATEPCWLVAVYASIMGKMWSRIGGVQILPKQGVGTKIAVRSSVTLMEDAGLNININREELGRDLDLVGPTVLALTAALSSKSVITHKEAAPDKLNKKRASRGKAPISAYSRISVNIPKEYARGDASESGRKPPSLHWRRGHIRHWHDGRQIPIAPMIVGMGEEAPLKKEYRVGLGKSQSA